MIRPGTCLFLYGTLMSAARTPLGHIQRRRLHREARFLGPAAIRGELYRIGRYTALTDGGEGAGLVRGELVLLTRPKATFGWLDGYEAPDYARVERPVRLASGEITPAWIYLYLGAMFAARPVACNRWQP